MPIVRYLLAATLWMLLAEPAQLMAATPPIQGQMLNYQPFDPPRPVPDTPFLSADGHAIKLADLSGQVVLVNFWATWCGPCVRELPSLARLAEGLAGENFTLLLVSIDRKGARVYEPYLRDRLGLTELRSAADPKGRLSRALKVRGLPTSYILDAEGRLVGRLIGPAEWDGPDAKNLIRHYMGRP